MLKKDLVFIMLNAFFQKDLGAQTALVFKDKGKRKLDEVSPQSPKDV